MKVSHLISFGETRNVPENCSHSFFVKFPASFAPRYRRFVLALWPLTTQNAAPRTTLSVAPKCSCGYRTSPRLPVSTPLRTEQNIRCIIDKINSVRLNDHILRWLLESQECCTSINQKVDDYFTWEAKRTCYRFQCDTEQVRVFNQYSEES